VSAKKIRPTPIHGAALRWKTRKFTIPIFHERWCTGKPALPRCFSVPDASGGMADKRRFSSHILLWANSLGLLSARQQRFLSGIPDLDSVG
jgi:hypothetical protein